MISRCPFPTGGAVGGVATATYRLVEESRTGPETRSDPTHVKQLGAYDDRRSALASELTAERQPDGTLRRTQGPAATRADVDALVASPEAKAQRRAYELNQQRRESGLHPLEIHTPPFVVAEDGTRISSTRIRNGEIDVHGRLLDASE